MTRSFIRILSLLVLVPALLAAQDQGLHLRVFDVEGTSRGELDDANLPWELALRQAYKQLEGDLAGFDDEAADGVSGADMLVRMIRDLIDPASWEAEGRFMRLNETGTRLFVRQTTTNLDRIAALLDAHAAIKGRSITIDALVIAGGAAELAGLGGGRNVVASERFERIRQGGAGLTVLASMTGSARDGQRLLLRSGEVRHFLALQAAQIAQTASLAEPRGGRVFAGAELAVRPAFAPDGRINIRVQARLGSGLGFETWRSRSPGVGPIELPSLRQSLFSSSAMLAAGEALVLGAIGAGDGQPRFLLVRARSETGADPAIPGARFGVEVFRCGYLTTPLMSLPRLDLGHVGVGARIFDEFERGDRVFGGGLGHIGMESVMDLVRQTVTPRFWDENRYLLDPDGSLLWIGAGSEQLQGVGVLLRALAAERARFLDVEAFCLRIERARLEELRRGGEGEWLRELLRSPQALRLHAMAGSVELGARIEFAEGLERAFVPETDADVAQGADILVPAVETGFRGLYLRLAPYRLDERRLGLDYEYQLIGPRFDLEAVAEPAGAAADLRLARAGWSRSRGHLVAALGDYALLAETAADEPGAVLLLVVRLR